VICGTKRGSAGAGRGGEGGHRGRKEEKGEGKRGIRKNVLEDLIAFEERGSGRK